MLVEGYEHHFFSYGTIVGSVHLSERIRAHAGRASFNRTVSCVLWLVEKGSRISFISELFSGKVVPQLVHPSVEVCLVEPGMVEDSKQQSF